VFSPGRLRAAASRGKVPLQSAKKIPIKNGLGQVVALIAVLPVDPDILKADVSAVTGFVERIDNAFVVDRVVLEARLQPAISAAPRT
jgi:hypothetical protein